MLVTWQGREIPAWLNGTGVPPALELVGALASFALLSARLGMGKERCVTFAAHLAHAYVQVSKASLVTPVRRFHEHMR